MDVIVRGYKPEDAQEWDSFVLNQSVNGTVFHTRNFLNYHSEDKFIDNSLMFYENEKLVSVIPIAKVEQGLFSHPGTSGGGLIVSNKSTSIGKLIGIRDALLGAIGDQKLTFRVGESIFSTIGSDVFVYLFGSTHDMVPELSVYKELQYEEPIASITRSRTRTSVRKSMKNAYQYRELVEDAEWESYYQILAKNLVKYEQTPTHTLEEFLDLKERLGDSSKLFGFLMEGKVVSGVWLINARERIWHCQYIAKDYEVDDNGLAAASLIMAGDWVKQEFGAVILNYGINTEQRGQYLNEYLCSFKQSLGGEFCNRYIAIPK